MDSKKHTILISAVSGDIGCSAVRALRETSQKIIGCDIKSYTPVADQLDRFYEIPAAADKGYLLAIKKIIKEEGVSFFLPISEPEIQLVDEKREELTSGEVKLLLNNSTIISNFLDKLKTAQYLREIGLVAPKTVLLSEYDGSFKFPVIVKPRTGYGSKRLWKAEDEDDLKYLRRKDDGLLIVQEYIGTDSDEYTTGVFSDGKRVSSITFRRKLGFGGLSAEAILVDERDVEDLSVQVARAVHLVGSINIQSRRTGNTFIPFEINPRLSSTLLFRKKFGFDDLTWWIDVLCGKDYSYEKKYKSGKAIRHMSECYFDIVTHNN